MFNITIIRFGFAISEIIKVSVSVITGDPNTLSSIKINVLLYTCVPVSSLYGMNFNQTTVVRCPKGTTKRKKFG